MKEESLDVGVFTLSLDFELIWGTLDLFGPERFRAACERERDVVRRLLQLFVELEIPATWCVLGHLFLDRCAPRDGQPHPELKRPRHDWVNGDWFGHDTGGDEASRPTFYGRSLVEEIKRCPATQEIGSHSFSHVIFGDPGCSEDVAESEVSACVELARAAGVELRSFVFPRNRVGHLTVLRRHGIRAFRGPGPAWYEQKGERGSAARAAHLWDVLTAAEPPVVIPRRTPEGLVDVPGSMIFLPAHGVRRMIPVSLRVARARKGIRAAAERRRLFHLWFHPTNLADNTDAMLAGLREILEVAAAERASGRIRIQPMAEVAALYSNG